ncbi:mechanosensitive ion channel family protein [Nodosilinea sp. LEGE 07088]|uniref:mechanosensitive ion channel family protein n=1 Tax=Nodosilinea sp. LEGE 07088 TaxID=2777968 RepID=UPI00187E2231|nr:mechanosensitive ion channel family protein [Nodosilinea sp. LEGE 07088]MBE9135777.1 mechanosensitive ion channel family protein [Nodosilinea sp. LEGE 07088]
MPEARPITLTTRPITLTTRPSQPRWPVWLRLVLGLGLGVVLALGWGWATSAAIAQLSNPFSPNNNGSLPPAGVQRVGLLEVTAVNLDGQALFSIASPAVLNRNDPGAAVPVEIRAGQIEGNLNQVVNQAVSLSETDDDSAEDTSLGVIIEPIGEQPVLFAVGAGLVEPKVLITVIDTDARYNGLSSQALAKRWQEILTNSLKRAVNDRLPDARQRQVRNTLWIILGSTLSTFVLAGLWKGLDWRTRALERRLAAQTNPADAIQPDNDMPLSYQITLTQRLQLVAFLRWLIFWTIALLWISAIASGLYIFPQTRSYAFRLFSIPVLLVLTWFIAGLLNRLANLGIERVTQAWSQNELGDLEEMKRKSMRLSTITGAAKGLKTAVIYALATLLVLQRLQIASGSLLAFGAIAALALSFAAQSLVKDLVNGFLILLENQYAIGDLVTTGTTTGIVENLNLRITQIRGEDGRLVTLPNSLIAQVDNLSRSWSRANLKIDVAYGTNVDQALWVVHETAQVMASDPEWRYDILNPVEMLGVEAMTHAGLTILIWIRTRPLKQFLVAREFRRRLRIAFDRADIAIGVPQQIFTGSDNRFETNNPSDSIPAPLTEPSDCS